MIENKAFLRALSVCCTFLVFFTCFIPVQIQTRAIDISDLPSVIDSEIDDFYSDYKSVASDVADAIREAKAALSGADYGTSCAIKVGYKASSKDSVFKWTITGSGTYCTIQEYSNYTRVNCVGKLKDTRDDDYKSFGGFTVYADHVVLSGTSYYFEKDAGGICISVSFPGMYYSNRLDAGSVSGYNAPWLTDEVLKKGYIKQNMYTGSSSETLSQLEKDFKGGIQKPTYDSNFDDLLDVLNDINKNIKKIPGQISAVIASLFIIDKLTDTKLNDTVVLLSSTFAFVFQLFELGDILITFDYSENMPTLPPINYNGHELSIVDWSLAEPYIPYVKNLIGGISIYLYLRKLRKKIPGIIAGEQ